MRNYFIHWAGSGLKGQAFQDRSVHQFESLNCEDFMRAMRKKHGLAEIRILSFHDLGVIKQPEEPDGDSENTEDEMAKKKTAKKTTTKKGK